MTWQIRKRPKICLLLDLFLKNCLYCQQNLLRPFLFQVTNSFIRTHTLYHATLRRDFVFTYLLSPVKSNNGDKDVTIYSRSLVLFILTTRHSTA